MKTLNLQLSKRIAEILGSEAPESEFYWANIPHRSKQWILLHNDSRLPKREKDVPAYTFQEIPLKLLGEKLGWQVQFDEDKGFNFQWLHYAQRLNELRLTKSWEEMENQLLSLIK